jgi:hypothetical protein
MRKILLFIILLIVAFNSYSVNSISKTTNGIVGYDNYEDENYGQYLSGAVATSPFTYSNSKSITQAAQDGNATNLCLSVTYSGYQESYGANGIEAKFMTYTASTYIGGTVAQMRFAAPATSSWHSITAVSVNASTVATWNGQRWGNQNSNNQLFPQTAFYNLDATNNGATTRYWYTKKISQGRTNASYVRYFDTYNNLSYTVEATGHGGVQTYWSPGCYWSFRMDNYDGAQYIDDVGVFLSDYVNVTGLATNMVVNVEDYLGKNIGSAKANSVGLAQLDFSNYAYPLKLSSTSKSGGGVKFLIYGTDGGLVYTSPSYVTHVVGGDTWTYSGEFSAPTPTPVNTNTPVSTPTPAGGCLDLQTANYGYPAITVTSKATYIPLTNTAAVNSLYTDTYMSVTYSALSVYVSEVCKNGQNNTTTAYYRVACLDAGGNTQYSQGKMRLMPSGAETGIIGHNYIFPITTVGFARTWLECMTDNGTSIATQDIGILTIPLASYSGSDRYLYAASSDSVGVTSNGSTQVTIKSVNINANTRSHYLLSFSCNDTGYVGGSSLSRTGTWSLTMDGAVVDGIQNQYLSSGTDVGNPKMIALTDFVDAGYHTFTARFICDTGTANRQIVSYNNSITVIKLSSQNNIAINAGYKSYVTASTTSSKSPVRILGTVVDLFVSTAQRVAALYHLNQYLPSGTTGTAQAVVDINGSTATGSAERYLANTNDRGAVWGFGRSQTLLGPGYVSAYISHYSEGGNLIASNNANLILIGGCGDIAPSPTATQTVTPTPTITLTITPSATITPTFTPTPKTAGGKVINEMGGM